MARRATLKDDDLFKPERSQDCITPPEARARLRSLPGWSLRTRGGRQPRLHIERNFSLPTPLAATLLAAFGAEVARAMERPIRVKLSGTTVTLTLPGETGLDLSEIDFEVASRISLIPT